MTALTLRYQLLLLKLRGRERIRSASPEIGGTSRAQMDSGSERHCVIVVTRPDACRRPCVVGVQRRRWRGERLRRQAAGGVRRQDVLRRAKATAFTWGRRVPLNLTSFAETPSWRSVKNARLRCSGSTRTGGTSSRRCTGPSAATATPDEVATAQEEEQEAASGTAPTAQPEKHAGSPKDLSVRTRTLRRGGGSCRRGDSLHLVPGIGGSWARGGVRALGRLGDERAGSAGHAPGGVAA
jgi:hypothetical protein